MRAAMLCLLLLGAVFALSGCMRQDYHFIGHMMGTDAVSAANAQQSDWVRTGQLAGMPVPPSHSGGRG